MARLWRGRKLCRLRGQEPLAAVHLNLRPTLSPPQDRESHFPVPGVLPEFSSLSFAVRPANGYRSASPISSGENTGGKGRGTSSTVRRRSAPLQRSRATPISPAFMGLTLFRPSPAVLTSHRRSRCLSPVSAEGRSSLYREQRCRRRGSRGTRPRLSQSLPDQSLRSFPTIRGSALQSHSSPGAKASSGEPGRTGATVSFIGSVVSHAERFDAATTRGSASGRDSRSTRREILRSSSGPNDLWESVRRV